MYINNYTSSLKMSMNQINQATRSVSQSQSRISSGDSFAGKNENPASYSQASRAEALMRGSSAASRNIQDANAFLETKENALSKMGEIGQRLRELAVQYENDTLSQEDKSLIQKESASLLKEIEHSLKNTSYNGKNVFEPKDLKVQTSSNASDTFTIQSNNLFSFSFDSKEGIKPSPPVEEAAPIKPVEPDKTEPVEKKYQVAIKSGPYSDTNGEMTVKKTDDPNVSTFTIKSNNLQFVGKITTMADGKERFHLDNTTPYGKLAGEAKLEKNASRDELEGRHQFILDREYGGVSITLEMKEIDKKNPPEKPVPPVEVKPPVGNDSKELKFELNTDFIDKHILNPITQNRVQVGIERNSLEYRLESAMNAEVSATNNLSRIRDTDTAKEIMKMTKQQMLIDINANLFSKSLAQNRNHILSLLS